MACAFKILRSVWKWNAILSNLCEAATSKGDASLILLVGVAISFCDRNHRCCHAIICSPPLAALCFAPGNSLQRKIARCSRVLTITVNWRPISGTLPLTSTPKKSVETLPCWSHALLRPIGRDSSQFPGLLARWMGTKQCRRRDNGFVSSEAFTPPTR